MTTLVWGTKTVPQMTKKQAENIKRKRLAIKIRSSDGTDFQKQVWLTILSIPKGKTVTYTELAEMSGFPKAVRAVASACGKNPFAPHVPCHRVLASNGLGGYSGEGGLKTKLHLLKSEGYVVKVTQI